MAHFSDSRLAVCCDHAVVSGECNSCSPCSEEKDGFFASCKTQSALLTETHDWKKSLDASEASRVHSSSLITHSLTPPRHLSKLHPVNMVVAPLVRSGCLASRALRTSVVSSSFSSAVAASSSSTSQLRTLHTCPPTPEPLSEGCAPFLSSSTIKQISQNWQSGLLELLNQEVRDTEFASSSIVETVIGLSQNREKLLAFNYASQALNNAFFLSTLAPQDRLRNPTPLPKLATAISKSFGSFPEMCLAFSSAAYGMSASGWVWLVTDQQRNLGVVPTFGAGTVIVQNRIQQGKHFSLPSINDQPPATTDVPKTHSQDRPTRPVDSLFRGLGITDKVGKELYPLLNISVHEHAWLNDYGIMGKEEYLTTFWNCVNWDKVEERFESYCPQSSRYL